MDAEVFILFAIYGVIAVFVIVSNTALLILLIREHKKKKRSHRFVTSSIISDLCSGIVCISYGYVIREFHSDNVGICFGNVIFIVIFRYSTLLIKLAAIVDRYWAIVHPISYHLHATDAKIKAMIGSTWLLSVLFATMAIPFQGENECDVTITYVIYFVGVLVPSIFAAIIILSLRILVALKNRKSKNKFGLNATTMILISSSCACILWIPATVIYVFYRLDRQSNWKLWCYLYLYYAQPIFNALLYFYAINKKRGTLKKANVSRNLGVNIVKNRTNFL